MAATTETDGGAQPHPQPQAPEPTRARQPRIYRGELTSAVSALGLLVVMFLTKWYGVAGVPDPSAARPAISTAENAWNGLTIVRWVMLATIVAALGSVVLHASQRSHGTRTDTSLVIVTLGSLTSLLLLYRVLIVLPQSSMVIDQKLGALVGLACAFGIALGGLESIREQRTHSRALSRHPRRRQRSDSDRALLRLPSTQRQASQPTAQHLTDHDST
jgi:hypothetical protein